MISPPTIDERDKEYDASLQVLENNSLLHQRLTRIHLDRIDPRDLVLMRCQCGEKRAPWLRYYLTHNHESTAIDEKGRGCLC
mmetsp:Transcript_13890/g.30391  ORF Transcript_13890/g.30391 Transcript_13890/m.30391 type:complete len:82 (+) Transcript_13890:1504-1749(+)